MSGVTVIIIVYEANVLPNFAPIRLSESLFHFCLLSAFLVLQVTESDD